MPRNWMLNRARLLLAATMLCAGLTVAHPAAAAGTISLTALGAAATENFDTLAITGTSNVLPNGWYLAESGTSANDTYTAGTGSENTGDTYSFGASASSERALGGVASGSVIPRFGASLTNNTGTTINRLLISYTGEQWRLGLAGRVDRLDAQISTDATSLTSGTYTDADALDFTAPVAAGTVGALDGNAAANRAAVSATLTGLNIPNGATIWLRWVDLNASGADDGLAVDDFSVTPLDASGDLAPTVSATTPGSNASGVPLGANLSVTFSEPVNVGAGWVRINCTSGSTYTAAQIQVSGGPTTYTLDPATDFAAADRCTATITAALVSDQDSTDPPDTLAADYSWSFTTTAAGSVTRISQVQGAAHRSPLARTIVTVEGIVTAVKTGSSGGFYLQEETADQDANPATSEGVLVFTNATPAGISVGDLVRVTGTVTEFRPGGSGGTNNLTITELAGTTTDALVTNVVSSGNPLPPATVIGVGGRVPPTSVIDSGTNGDVELTGTFDAANHGIDFYESLEGMRVQVNDAVAVGPTTSNGEIAVLADNGAGAGLRTPRGGIIVAEDYSDFNPERIILDDAIVNNEPAVNVADRFATPVVGVMDYSFGNFKLLVTGSWPAVTSGGLTKEVTTLAAPKATDLSISSINVENLAPSDAQAKYDRLAQIIVTNLQAPDIVGVEEMQDNTGETNDGVVAADQTFAKLIAAITAAGGPTYSYRQIDPVNNQDGGAPGGNIRVGLLFRTDRGVAFVDRPGGTSTAPVSVNNVGGKPALSFSPGRVQPGDGAFNSSRKPLAAELTFNGRTLFVVVNHFNSKGGDQPLFGRFQPPARSSEAQRIQQAAIVNAFVDSILAIDSGALVAVVGDLNDFEFSPALDTLRGPEPALRELAQSLPRAERYTYVFDGNSQTLDHQLASTGLRQRLLGYDVVHVNSEFADQVSDHDPSLARYAFGALPPQRTYLPFVWR